jgi:hypothetical protein
MEYIYFTVKCKTPGCSTVVVLQYGGIHDPEKPRFSASPSDTIRTLRCPKCEQYHDYEGNDIQLEISSTEPPPEWLRSNSKKV